MVNPAKKKITRRGFAKLCISAATAGALNPPSAYGAQSSPAATQADVVDQNPIRRRGTGLRALNVRKASPGLTLFAPLAGDGTVYLMSLEGKVVHTWKMPYPPGLYGYLTQTGTLFYNGKIPNDKDLRSAGYDRVTVFTQYTDTMDFLREHLSANGTLRVMCYSGRGGEFRNADGTWQVISRDDAKRRFRERQADVLLCTDAAAEGLNFQFCGAMVNYDMPWNPMRVEQRIGRIDRLGQLN